jgi:hypothetical protein
MLRSHLALASIGGLLLALACRGSSSSSRPSSNGAPETPDDAITEICKVWGTCYGFSIQECRDFKNLEREDAVSRGCGDEWDALTQCNATHPFACSQSFSDYCIEQKVASDRCDNPEDCTGYGSAPQDGNPIPCAYHCNDNSLGGECVGTTLGEVQCTCTAGPRTDHTFQVYDCEEFLTSFYAQCGAPMTQQPSDGGTISSDAG